MLWANEAVHMAKKTKLMSHQVVVGGLLIVAAILGVVIMSNREIRNKIITTSYWPSVGACYVYDEKTGWSPPQCLGNLAQVECERKALFANVSGRTYFWQPGAACLSVAPGADTICEDKHELVTAVGIINYADNAGAGSDAAHNEAKNRCIGELQEKISAGIACPAQCVSQPLRSSILITENEVMEEARTAYATCSMVVRCVVAAKSEVPAPADGVVPNLEP